MQRKPEVNMIKKPPRKETKTPLAMTKSQSSEEKCDYEGFYFKIPRRLLHFKINFSYLGPTKNKCGIKPVPTFDPIKGK